MNERLQELRGEPDENGAVLPPSRETCEWAADEIERLKRERDDAREVAIKLLVAFASTDEYIDLREYPNWLRVTNHSATE